MRTAWILAVAVAQLGVLAFMAGEREWVVRRGQPLHLRTAPLDPRDPMRGDFVRLDYEIAHLPRGLARDAVKVWVAGAARGGPGEVRDRIVYVEVRKDEAGVAEAVAVSDRPPAEGLFLRGRVRSIDSSGLWIRYGIEALFLQQGKAAGLEEEMRRRAGVPLAVEVAVSPGGLAVTRGYRWEPLGLTVVLERPPAARGGAGGRLPPLTGLTVELKNHDAEPVAIVVQPGGRSFRLIRNERAGTPNPFRWVGEESPAPAPAAAAVRLLQPGESHRERLDLAAPEWFVVDTARPQAAPVALATLAADPRLWQASFRIEYAPPRPAGMAARPEAGRIRHSRLRSRAFGPAGGLD